MIKSLIIIGTIIVSLNLFGQSWTPFQFGEHYFISKSTLTTEEPLVSFKKGEILNLIADSVVVASFFPERINGCDIRDVNSSCYGSLESCSDRFSWIGSPTMIYGSQWMTVNRFGDTISFKSPFSISDTILKKPDTLYIVHLTELDTLTINNEIDSIRIFSIEVRDLNGTLTNNVWNGDTLIWSKSNGFIQLPSWYLFPRYEAWFQLFQHEATSDFSFNDVYPYKPGDILHSRLKWETGQMPNQRTYLKQDLKQCTILTVDSSNVENQYKANCITETTKKYYSTNYPFDLDSSSVAIYRDTVWWTSSNLALFQEDQLKETTAISLVGDNLEIHKEDIQIGMPSSQCPWFQNQFEPLIRDATTIRVGIGEIEHHSFILSNFPTGSYSTHDKELVYFKSQTQQFGNPTWPVGINETLLHKIQTYPNPTNGIITVNSEIPILQIEVFNSTGILVEPHRRPLNSAVDIDLESLPLGLYFFRIKTENGTVTKRIVKTSN